MNKLPKVGERLVVHRMEKYISKIAEISWSYDNHDWMIQLDWGKYGTSRVWARDEGKIWHRLTNYN